MFLFGVLLGVVKTVQLPNFSATVTYTTRAARAAVVLPELGRLAGIDIETTPQTESEILIVSVKDQPLSEVLKRIATVTSGEWKHDGTTVLLAQNQKVRAREERNDLDKRVAQFKKNVDDRLDREKDYENLIAEAEKKAASGPNKTKKGIEEDDDPVDPQQLRRSLANDTLLRSLLQSVDPILVAKSPGRVVFSTDPTRKQLPFEPKAVEAINDFVQTHNAMAPSVPPSFVDQLDGLDKEEAEAKRKELMAEIAKIGPLTKVLLIGEPSMSEARSFSVVFYNADGKVVFSIHDPRYSGGLLVETDEPTKPVVVPYSQDSAELLKVLSQGWNDRKDEEIGPLLMRKLMLPASYDPLSYNQTDDIFAYSKLKGKPLVAEIPDTWHLWSARWDDSPTHWLLSDVESAIHDGQYVSELQDSSFETLMPSNPARSRANRLDRLALSRLLQAEEESGVPDIDDVYSFVTHSPEPSIYSPIYDYVKLLAPALPAESPWVALKFVGSLSLTQRENAIKAGGLPFASLSRPQKELLEKIVFEDGQGCMVYEKGQDPRTLFVPGDFGGWPEDYRSEQTEVAPNGLPDDAVVEINVAAEPFALRTRPDGAGRLGDLAIVDSDVIASSRMVSEGEDSQHFPPMGEMRVGERDTFNITIHIGPQTQKVKQAVAYRLPKGAKIVTEKDLPANFQQAIAASLKAKQAEQDQSTDQDKQVIPPREPSDR